MRLPIRRWKKTLSALGFQVLETSEKQRRRRRTAQRAHQPRFEPLEPRQLLTTTLVDDDTLSILDNGDPGFEQTGFTYQSNSQVESAYGGDNHNMRGGEGTATWTFDNLEEGEYQVAATWAHKYGNKYNAPDAPFTLRDGETQRSQVLVDQKNLPAEFTDAEGVTWDTLDTISVTSGTLRVELSEAPGNNYVVADAVRIEQVGIELTDIAFNSQIETADNTGDAPGPTPPFLGNTMSSNSVLHWDQGIYNDYGLQASLAPDGWRNPDYAGFEVATDPSGMSWYHSPDNPNLGYISAFGTSENAYSPGGSPFEGVIRMGYPDQYGSINYTVPESYKDNLAAYDPGGWAEQAHASNWAEYGGTGMDWATDPTGQWWYDTDLTDNTGDGDTGDGDTGDGDSGLFTDANDDSGGSSLQDGAIPYNKCLDGCLILEYSPKSKHQPIIGGNYRLPEAGSATERLEAGSVTERLEARLTFGGVVHDWVHYDTSGLAAGDSVALNLAADVPDLESGRHAYSIEVREITGGNAVTRTISGHRQIFNRGGSEFGDRWSLGGLKRIVAGDDGVSVFDGGVGGYWYEEVAGTDQFITPLSQFDTLVQEDGVYTITDPYGNREVFNSLGLLVSTTDRNGNQTSYAYVDANPNDNDPVADEIALITDPYEREKSFVYNGDGRLDTITNRAKSDNSGGRVTTFEYDAGNLWKIHRPAPDDGITAPVTEFSYDANGFMTGVREGSASASGTTMVGNFANRLTSTTNADETVWSLEAALTVGLVEPGSGLPGTSPENPMPAFTADQSKTTLTDERGFETTITFDRYGGETSRVDALDNSYLWDRDEHGRVTRTVAPAAGGGTLETLFTYDDRGNLIQTDYADGTHESWAYDPDFNQLTSYTDPLDRQTLYTIDPANGNVLAVTQVVGQLDSDTEETDDVSQYFTYTDISNAVVAGLLLTETDPLGTVTEYEYFDTSNSCGCHSGLLKSITVGLGTAAEATTEYEYDEAGNMSAEIDPLGRRTEYEYDNLDRLIRMEQVDPEGENPTTLYTYNARDQLLTETDPLGSVTSYTYDAMGRLETITAPDPDGAGPLSSPVTSYTYDEAGNLKTETDALENETSYDYDKLGRLETITAPDPDGAGPLSSPLTSYTYDAAGNLETETDPLENVTSYTYDDLGRLETITNTDPDGAELSETSYTYDLAGNLKTATDALENETSYDYDDLGRLETITAPDPDGAGPLSSPVTSYTYDAAGNLKTETDALENITRYDYDDLGRLIKTTLPDADGNPATTDDIPVFEYTYDLAGNPKTEKDPLGNITSYFYDDLGRLEAIAAPDPAGGGPLSSPVTSYTYDLAGNLKTETDPLENITRYDYDALGRTIATTDAGGNTVLSSYDAAGNRLTLTDPLGNQTSWIYDDLHRPTEEQNGSGFSRLREYDAAGNLTSQTDRNGRRIEYGYDDLHRRTTEQWLDENEIVLHQFDTRYDRAGQILSASYDTTGELFWAGDGASQYDYSYDNLGRVTDQFESYQFIAMGILRHNEYDLMGNRTRASIVFGDWQGAITDTTYDNLYRTTRIEQYGVEGGVPTADKRVDFSYDQAGQWDTITRYHDLAGQQVAVATDYAFDPAGRLTGITHAAGDGTALAGYGWTYDAAQRVTRFDSLIDGETLYNYDDLDQLTGATSDYQLPEAYDYDEAGNRIGGDYVIDPLNQLQEDAAYRYRYDNEGNRTARIDKQTGETTLYEWDYRNRLTTISSYDCDPEAFGNAVLQKTVTQTYDVWNQWVRRQVDSGSPLIADTYFIYDAGQLVMSFDALCGSNATEGRISRGTRYLWGPAVDQLLAEEGVKYQGSEGTLWQLTDNLGSVRDLAEYDEASGTTSVVNHITYDAFGNVTSETAAVDHLFGFTGRAYDEETDLQNNHNRWYDAASGKWLSEDPIGFAADDANLYRYVGNNATNATDPSGLQQYFGSSYIEHHFTSFFGGIVEWFSGGRSHVVNDERGMTVRNDRLPGKVGGVLGGSIRYSSLGALNCYTEDLSERTPLSQLGFDHSETIISWTPLEPVVPGYHLIHEESAGDRYRSRSKALLELLLNGRLALAKHQLRCGSDKSVDILLGAGWDVYDTYTEIATTGPDAPGQAPDWVWPWSSNASWDMGDTWDLWFGGGGDGGGW